MTMQMSWAGLTSCQEGKLACSFIYSAHLLLKIVTHVRTISSYAFKMRQDYLSTRYWDQFIPPSFGIAHLDESFDPSN